MKIAVSTMDGNTVCGHLGRCIAFIVFDTEEGIIKSRELRTNDRTAHAAGQCSHGDGEHEEHDHAPGHGTHGHAGVIDLLSDCQTVITAGMGRRIMLDLEEAGIEAIIASADDAESTVMGYLNGSLVSNPAGACGCH